MLRQERIPEKDAAGKIAYRSEKKTPFLLFYVEAPSIFSLTWKIKRNNMNPGENKFHRNEENELPLLRIFPSNIFLTVHYRFFIKSVGLNILDMMTQMIFYKKKALLIVVVQPCMKYWAVNVEKNLVAMPTHLKGFPPTCISIRWVHL